LAVSGLLALAGCKKEEKPAGTVVSPTGGELRAPVLQPIGMVDPFARLAPEAGKALERGYKALRSKKWDDAAKEFRAVIALAPDYTPARWSLVRALAIGGKFTEVPAAFEELVARDYVAYADKLDKPKDFAGLRNAPEWAKLTEVRGRYKPAYAQGLDKGFFFVARNRPANEPKFEGDAKEAPLDLRQEVFHYDLDGKRFRRVTESDGHAFAINRATDGKTLAFLVAPRLHRERGADSFVDPKVGVIDLQTLDTVGPFVMKGQYDQVMLGTNQSGQPLFTFVVSTGSSATYTIDTAKSGLAKLEGGAVLPTGGETRAWPNQVAHLPGKAVDGVKMTDGANQFAIDGQPAPVIAARPLAQSSLEWSPGKTRITYAGKLDACKILKGGGDKNELYVFDVTKKSAQRVAAAVSAFETLWLDDDHLVYEGGVGKDGQIHLYAFTAHADSSLPTRHGAGLYGVPTLACEQAETGVDEDLGEGAATDEEGD
jgi:hypothetical protein